MLKPEPVVLESYGVRLEPLTPAHRPGLEGAARDGELWNLWFTSVPAPDEVDRYIQWALEEQSAGTMLPWAVRDLANGNIVGSTRYHDIIERVDRVEIGYTWYAAGSQRTQVNAACKLMLLAHAFEDLRCKVVGFRTDNFNFRSQRAIERLGAKKDGVIRHHMLRRDDSVRDSVMYSILDSEWPDVRKGLELRLNRCNIG